MRSTCYAERSRAAKRAPPRRRCHIGLELPFLSSSLEPVACAECICGRFGPFRRNVAKSRGVKFHALAEMWDASCVSDPEGCRERLYLYQWMVRSRPSSKVVRARKPNSRRARSTSKQRRGWPFGWEASHANRPLNPVRSAIFLDRLRIEISCPLPRLTGSGLS